MKVSILNGDPDWIDFGFWLVTFPRACSLMDMFADYCVCGDDDAPGLPLCALWKNGIANGGAAGHVTKKYGGGNSLSKPPSLNTQPHFYNPHINTSAMLIKVKVKQ